MQVDAKMLVDANALARLLGSSGSFPRISPLHGDGSSRRFFRIVPGFPNPSQDQTRHVVAGPPTDTPGPVRVIPGHANGEMSEWELSCAGGQLCHRYTSVGDCD